MVDVSEMKSADEFRNPKRRSVETKSYAILSKINECIVRENFDGEFYHNAYFKIKDSYYAVVFPGVLMKWNKYRNEYRELVGSRVKNRIYVDYCIDGVSIKSHVLVMLCLTDWFFDRYMSDSSLVVNHCVVSEYGCYHSSYLSPRREVSHDVRYLEVIPNWSNAKHGRFIERYNLLDVYVSANDINSLEEIFESNDYDDVLSLTKDFYKDKNFAIAFN